jgi:hypothetical protein
MWKSPLIPSKMIYKDVQTEFIKTKCCLQNHSYHDHGLQKKVEHLELRFPGYKITIHKSQ